MQEECVMSSTEGAGEQAAQQQEETERRGSHAAPDGAGVHPLIDLSRDPNPGKADHAKPDDE
jgi:hypothetical protein